MATNISAKQSLEQIQDKITSQFRGMNFNDPGTWKLLPQIIAYVIVATIVFALLSLIWIKFTHDDLIALEEKELSLRAEYSKKIVKATNLEALKKQRTEVLQYVTELEKQLPSKAEMDALLSNINQAGIARRLQFELFRPGQVKLADYYAELPITLKVTGGFHDIGFFASDVAHLSRIVTLKNLTISPLPARDGVLTLEATANTFRYLDTEEIQIQKKLKAEKAKTTGANK